VKKRISTAKVRGQDKWRVHTADDNSIGEIAWDKPWRKHVYWPEAFTVYDASCLRELAEILDGFKRKPPAAGGKPAPSREKGARDG
jgi:hypothetical protein